MILATAPLITGTASSFATPAFTGITPGTIQNASISEASGIAASRINPNVLWTHQDSGASAEVYAMTPTGVNLGTYSITGASAFDWEDIAVGPGPTAGAQYIYAGDIGDNLAIRSNVTVYRALEPAVSDTQSPVSTSISGAAKLTFAYPDGARDAESLFVDPATKDIYIISKRDATKHVYRAAYPQSTSGTTTLQLVTTLPNATWITAADLSPDGDELIMRGTATNTGLLYSRPIGGSIADILASTPISIPLLSESQGEAIGFDPQGWGYYTTSEGAGAPVHYFNRQPSPAGTMYWDNDGVSAGSRDTTGAGTGGTGTWNTSSFKWYTGSAEVAWVNGNDAIFWGSAGTVTLAAAQNVNSLSFKTTGYQLTGSTITLGGSSITVDPGLIATINSIVAGSAGLTKNGTGTLTLTNVNTYIGVTTVSAGTLAITKNLTASTSATVATGATLKILSASAAVIKTGTVATTGTGKIDLTDNKLVVTSMSMGTWNGSNYDSVTALIRSGLNNGTWTGGGIITSMSDAQSGLTTLGIAKAGDVGKSLFGGVSVLSDDVLVMYTYAGDANLDGLIDGTDYFYIDSNVGTPGANGYANGDFNYDGTIDGTDYFYIDSNITLQGAPFATSGEVDGGAEIANGITAVPEPSDLIPLVLGAEFLLCRRRRCNGAGHRSSDTHNAASGTGGT